jgi:hypothetical protein
MFQIPNNSKSNNNNSNKREKSEWLSKLRTNSGKACYNLVLLLHKTESFFRNNEEDLESKGNIENFRCMIGNTVEDWWCKSLVQQPSLRHTQSAQKDN